MNNQVEVARYVKLSGTTVEEFGVRVPRTRVYQPPQNPSWLFVVDSGLYDVANMLLFCDLTPFLPFFRLSTSRMTCIRPLVLRSRRWALMNGSLAKMRRPSSSALSPTTCLLSPRHVLQLPSSSVVPLSHVLLLLLLLLLYRQNQTFCFRKTVLSLWFEHDVNIITYMYVCMQAPKVVRKMRKFETVEVKQDAEDLKSTVCDPSTTHPTNSTHTTLHYALHTETRLFY